MEKSTVDKIRARFDNEVERFSHLDTGQVSTVDAKVSLELITESVKRIVPHGTRLLDIGCGAGNYTLKMLEKLPDLHCTLVDLSKPMLERALQRVSNATSGNVDIVQEDFRHIPFPFGHFDIILAGAVLHHLRNDEDWEASFRKLFNLIRPGGCLMISDLVIQENDFLTQYS